MLPQGIDVQEVKFPTSKSFPVFGLLTLALIYAKLTVHFYVNWSGILSPMIIFFSYKFVSSIYYISQQSNQDYMPLKQRRMNMLWNICQLLITAPLAVSTFYLGKLIEKASEQEDISDPLTHLFACLAFTLFVYLLYSISASKEKEDNNINNGQQSVVINFVLSLFGNSINFCAGGACNSFYVSTLSAFFSAFGIPIAQYVHYLNYLCLILLAFSLLSLYSVKQSVKYAPFLITFVGACLIVNDMFFYKYLYLIYVGNLLIIGSAIWNSKLNKFSFLKRRN